MLWKFNMTQANIEIERKKIIKALQDVMNRREIPEWLATPNVEFDNRTPNKVIEDGDYDLLWSMINGLNEGNPY